MPVIQNYTQSVLPEGGIRTQADASAFGAPMAAALSSMGSAVGAMGERMMEAETAQDVTNVHIQMAAARDKWTQEFQNRLNSATPGDDAFAQQLMDDVNTSLNGDGGFQPKTRRGQQLYQTLAAQMASEFGRRAVAGQALLAGEAARNGYNSLIDSGGRTVQNDRGQFDVVLGQTLAAIDDPSGMFSKVPQPVRDELKRNAAIDLAKAACVSFADKDPDGALATFGDPQKIRMAPSINVLKQGVVAGGRLDVGKETLQHAPAIISAAASHGVNSGVLAAQVDMGGGSDFQKQASDMGVLLNRYGGDYTKALAAHQMGTVAFERLLQANGNQWQKALPDSVASYVNDVLVKGGQVATGEAPTNPPEETMSSENAVSSFAPFNMLPWQDRSAVVQKAVQVSNLQRSMAMQEKQIQEMELRKKQEDFQTGQVKLIIDGKFSLKAAAANPLATASILENLDSFSRARVREIRSDNESRSNPGEVRRLMLMIHAADNDPTKTYNMDPVDASYRSGTISTNEYVFLRNEVGNLKNGASNSFAQQEHLAREAIYQTFMGNLSAKLPSGAAKAATAYYNAVMDLDAAVAAKRAKNEDPSDLLNPASRDYWLKPERLTSYMPDAVATLHTDASKVVQGTPQPQSAPAPAAEQMKEGTVSKSGKFIWKGGKWVAR